MPAKRTASVRKHRRLPAPETSIDLHCVGALRYHVPSLNREFDYTTLGRMLDPQLAETLAEAHVEYITRFSRPYAISSYQVLQRLAKFVIADELKANKLQQFTSLSSGAGAKAWRKVVQAFVVTLQKSQIALSTYVELIGSLFRALDEFTSRGLAAKCERPVVPKNYHAAGKHRPGLIEQSSKKSVTPELLAEFEAHINDSKIPLNGDEAHALLRAISTQVPKEILHDEVAVAKAIFRINAQAIADVRAAAEDTFLYWRDIWVKGQALLNASNISAFQEISRASCNAFNRASEYSHSLFSPNLGDKAIANFLNFFNEEFGPYVPSQVETKWPPLMKKAFWELGGRNRFDACFCLHRQGVAAAAILYLVDSGANVSTALNLTTESEQKTDDPNYVNFVSFKDRAGPEPIVKQLPLKNTDVRVTAAQALRDVKEMTHTRRKMYPDLLRDKLFVFTFFKEPSILTNNTLADNFKYMLRDRQMDSVWTPSAIRIAVGIEVSGQTNGNLAKVGQKLSHAVDSNTTPIYALRLPMRILLSRKIREYQTVLEAALATHTSRGPQLLGYSENEADNLVNKAIHTGLGFLCRDVTVRGGKVEDAGPSCPELGRSCADCQSRLFITDEDSLAEMIAVKESLSKHLESTGDGKLESWKEDWLDLYAFSIAVIHKAKRSRFSYLMPAAQRKAKKLLSNGFDPLLIRE